jgi:uncharacterized spore protein YtfJ
VTEDRPDLAALTRAADDALTVRRVFGEPYTADGALVVPVASVLGSHGLAGAGTTARAADAGALGVRVRPLGVYVIRGERVTWQPALDLNRVILGGQVAGAVIALALAVALRRRRR